MMRFENVSKVYKTPKGEKTVLHPTTFDVSERCNFGLLGRNGAGKSTLLKMIAGTIPVNSGRIEKRGAFSWPLGFQGSFHGALSGAENVSFVSEIYGVDEAETIAYVEEFAELGAYFHAPVRQYSSGMKARLAFGVSMAVRFDVYLIDEITEVGDVRFRKKCAETFREKLQDANIIMVSHNETTINQFCDYAMVIENGGLSPLMPVAEALKVHRANMA